MSPQLDELSNRPRLARLEDLARIKHVINAAYSGYLASMDTVPAPMRQDYRPAIKQNLVWVVGDPIVGVLSVLLKPDTLLLENVAVHPEAQGKGFGKALIRFAEQEAKRCGYSRVELYTNEIMTANIELYQRLGYREYDRHEEQGYRRVYMMKDL